jgi:hypothetical protein
MCYRELMGDLENEKELNQELEGKRHKAEKELKKREALFENEKRSFNQKQALNTNLSKEEQTRIKEQSRQGGRVLRTGQGIDVSDIDVDQRSGQGASRKPDESAQDADKVAKKKRMINKTKKGQAGCKCVIF